MNRHYESTDTLARSDDDRARGTPRLRHTPGCQPPSTGGDTVTRTPRHPGQVGTMNAFVSWLARLDSVNLAPCSAIEDTSCSDASGRSRGRRTRMAIPAPGVRARASPRPALEVLTASSPGWRCAARTGSPPARAGPIRMVTSRRWGMVSGARGVRARVVRRRARPGAPGGSTSLPCQRASAHLEPTAGLPHRSGPQVILEPGGCLTTGQRQTAAPTVAAVRRHGRGARARRSPHRRAT